MKGIIITAMLAAAVGACTPTDAQDPHPVPRTVVEAKAQMAAAVRHTLSWPRYRDPPGNVRGEDYQELFGDHVMIAQRFAPHLPPDHDDVIIIFIGRDGRYAKCSNGIHLAGGWTEDSMRLPRAGLTPVFTEKWLDLKTWGHSLTALYDGETGEAIWYVRRSGQTWWDWHLGHLQERLPAVTWEICPDFPSAEELGVGVNHAQTAVSYRELVAQDPGRRVLRPDLVSDLSQQAEGGR